jgi:HK97 family phage prohead protease
MTDLDVASIPTGKADHVRRAWPGELELRDADDGPQVVGRIIPFGVTADVADVIDGTLVRYRERFLPGCTAKVRQDASRTGGPRWVALKLGHVETLDERVGWARSIEEREDGVWATFGLYLDPLRLDKIRAMLRTSHTGLSVEFTDRIAPEVDVEAGLVSRRAIALHGVAATPVPQYADAMIASVRGGDDLDLGTPNIERVEAMLAELDGRGPSE